MSEHAPHIREVISWLKDRGATDVRIEHGGRHWKIVFNWQGKEFRRAIFGRPNDPTAAATQMKQILGRELGIGRDGEPQPIEPGRALAEVSFHGAKLIAIRGATPAETLVAMRPIVEDMGLDWGGQHKKLTQHPVLAQGVSVREIPSAGGRQMATMLPLNRLNFWLATIQADRLPNKATRDRVIAYQTECADVLFAHFFPLKPSAGDLGELVRRTDGIARMLSHKVTGMEGEVSQIGAGLLALAEQVKALVIVNDPRRAAVTDIPALQVAINRKVDPKGRRPLVQRIGNSLTLWCQQRGVPVGRDTRSVRLFKVDAVEEWLGSPCAAFIKDHIDAHRGQNVLQFPKNKPKRDNAA